MADKLVHQLRAGVPVGDVPVAEDAVGELGTGFKRQFLGKNEGIVAVQEDVGDLDSMVSLESNSMDTDSLLSAS